MSVTEDAQKMLEKYPLCNNCLGRQFAFLGYGIENRIRGKVIKILLTMKGHRLAISKDRKGISLLRIVAGNGAFPMAVDILEKLKIRKKGEHQCYLCDNRLETITYLVVEITKRLKDYDYERFLVGIKLPVKIEEREDEFRAEFEVQHGESIRNEFSRLIGKALVDETCKEVDFMKPQIVVLVNPFIGETRFQINSLFIKGRYKKLVRGIPQSKWLCHRCRGEGCSDCSGTGKLYPESVEEIIAEPTLEITKGETSSFHGAGREDVDVRMLGLGRPFILQIKKPLKRKIDLLSLEQTINKRAEGKIEVEGLRFAEKEMVVKLKQMETSQKTYRVFVEFEKKVTEKEICKLESSLTGTTIYQQTPTRVVHRRADRIREKHIYETRIKRVSPNKLEMRLRCQGGLYIKELVTGDQGRTNPNVSKIVGSRGKPLELDVLSVSTVDD